MKRGYAIAALIIGLGLVAAPAMFQMFTRAPKGGKMITAFRPYMTHANTAKFQRYMAEIDRADKESQAQLPQLLSARAGVATSEIAGRFPSVAELNHQWPAIFGDMSGDMLVKMDRMVPNYRAVRALPPFVLFPWFFVVPGLIVALLAALALQAGSRGRDPRRLLTALAVMGVAIIAAPAMFQMFTRAPKGAKMINSFKPLMTTKKVTTIQNYFLVIGSGEGQLRTQVEPLLVQRGMTSQQLASALPALDAFHRDWPRISSDMAPMIGTMSDNVSRFDAVKALPPFWLFPWFFVLPGLLIAGFAIAAREPRSTVVVAAAPPASPGSPARRRERPLAAASTPSSRRHS